MSDFYLSFPWKVMVLRAGRTNCDIKLQLEITLSFANSFTFFQSNKTVVLAHKKCWNVTLL